MYTEWDHSFHNSLLKSMLDKKTITEDEYSLTIKIPLSLKKEIIKHYLKNEREKNRTNQ